MVKKLLILLVAVGFCLLGWLVRPWFHPLIMHFVIHPLNLAVLGVILLIVMGAWRWVVDIIHNRWSMPTNYLWISLSVLLLVLGVPIILVMALEDEFRNLAVGREFQYQSREEFPQFAPVRLTPKNVAHRYAQDAFQEPQEYLGDSQIVLINNKLQRIFPRLPDGNILKLLHKLTGFVIVDVDTLERKVTIVDQEFKYADKLAIFDNLYYRLLLKKYFVSYVREPVYLQDSQDKWVTVVPYIAYKGGIVRVPYWGGVMVVNPDGSINDIPSSDLDQYPFLFGARLFPKELALFYSHAYSYRNGLLNKWFLHKEEIEIVNLPNDESVLHVATSEGFKQMVVAEPYGRAYGVYKIFFFDATTGKAELIEFEKNSLLTGPVAAADYIKKEYPTFDWSSFKLVEPRPLVIDSDLYWLMSVIPNDNAGIAATVLLNTKTNKVLKADTTEQLQALMSNQTISQDTLATSSAELIRMKIDLIKTQLQELESLVDK